MAPQARTYTISAQFEGVHFGLSTTDVHVLHNATSLFDAEIEGYGGDPAFHKVEGAIPTAAYSGRKIRDVHHISFFFSDTLPLSAASRLTCPVGGSITSMSMR